MSQTFIFFFLLAFPALFLSFEQTFLTKTKSHILQTLDSTPKMLIIPLKRYQMKRQIFDFISKFQTDNLTDSIKTFEKTNIPLYNYRNTQFIGEIAIGNATNVFRVIFDTGFIPNFLSELLNFSKEVLIYG